MGYTTDFDGTFKITPTLAPELKEVMQHFSETRRCTPQTPNDPPAGQPGLWCNWEPNEDGTEIRWNEAEKFYHYVDWLQYLIDTFLSPNGHLLNGEVTWEGESSDDLGKIIVVDNVMTVQEGKIIYV